MLVVSHESVGVVAFSLWAAFELHPEIEIVGVARSVAARATTAALSTLYQTRARVCEFSASETVIHLHILYSTAYSASGSCVRKGLGTRLRGKPVPSTMRMRMALC